MLLISSAYSNVVSDLSVLPKDLLRSHTLTILVNLFRDTNLAGIWTAIKSQWNFVRLICCH